MAGFFGQLASAAGQNMVQGQQFDTNQAELEQRQQQVAMNKMDLLQKQQDQKTKQSIGAYMQMTQKNDQSTIDSPEKSAKMFEHAAGMAAASGDYQAAAQMSNLAKGKRTEMSEAQDAIAIKKQAATEELSKVAFAVQADPSTFNKGELAKKAIAAGIDPTSIPNPGSPEFITFANAQLGASAGSKELRASAEKIKATAEEQKIAAKNHADSENDKRLARQQAAAIQAGIRLDNALERKDRAEEREQKREEKLSDIAAKQKYLDSRLTTGQKKGRDTVRYNTAEILRGVETLANVDPTTGASPYSDIKGNSLLKSIMVPALNRTVGAQSQIVTAAGANLGNLLGNLEAAMGGRGAGVGQQIHIERSSLPQEGDSPATKAFKLANIKEIATTAIRNSPGDLENDPKAQKTLEAFDKLVPFSTADVIAEANKYSSGAATDAQFRKTISEGAKYKQDFNKSISSGAAPTAPSAPPAIQSLLDKYKD